MSLILCSTRFQQAGVPRLNLCHKHIVGLELVIQEIGHAFEQIRGVLSFKMEGLVIVQVNHA